MEGIWLNIMSYDLWNSTLNAFLLLFSGDLALWEIIMVSLRVSLLAILISAPIALLLAFLISQHHCHFKRTLLLITHTLVAVPAVVVGLIVYLLLSKQGMLGDLHWLFSQKAMIFGQVLLSFPIILNISYNGFNALSQEVEESAITLGASRWQVIFILIFECRLTLLTALIMAFGRIIAEVGSAIMVGGNILHYTRNITTAITLETSKGEFSQGIALGIVLVVLALALNFLVLFFNKKI